MYNAETKLSDNAGAELISSSFRDERLTQRIYLPREQLRERVGRYGFIEIADILRFIDFICSSPPERNDYIFIRGKLDLCLRHHDDGGDYFIPLRELATELDCLIA
ncbi:TPA: hypothetical protein ACHTOV_004255 [Enterobacter cancerogenus]